MDELFACRAHALRQSGLYPSLNFRALGSKITFNGVVYFLHRRSLGLQLLSLMVFLFVLSMCGEVGPDLVADDAYASDDLNPQTQGCGTGK